jgi:hypothetical protein
MKYAKAYAAFVLTVATVVVGVLTDNAVDADELGSGTATVVQGFFVLLSAVGVAWVPNKKATANDRTASG